MNFESAKNLSVGELIRNVGTDSPASYNRIVMSHEIKGDSVKMILSNARTAKKVTVTVDANKEYQVIN